MSNKRRVGAVFEHRAAQYLEEHGYVILERNFFKRCGELDLIAEKDDTLVFVEVRHRSDSGGGHQAALESVALRKQQHICRTAAFYLKKRGIYDQVDIRFDVISVGSDDTVKHIKNAFDYQV